MRIQGIATRDTEHRTVKLSHPREGQEPNPTVAETVVLDESLGVTIRVTDWKDQLVLKSGAPVDIEIRNLKHDSYGWNATAR